LLIFTVKLDSTINTVLNIVPYIDTDYTYLYNFYVYVKLHYIKLVNLLIITLRSDEFIFSFLNYESKKINLN